MHNRYFIYLPNKRKQKNDNCYVLDLKKEIEVLRDKLNEKINEKNTLKDNEILKMSQKLDLLIELYIERKITTI